MNPIPRHKVFISFHTEDHNYMLQLKSLLENGFSISRTVEDGSILVKNQTVDSIMDQIRTKFLKDSSVTIVLVGKNTWRRRYVDWEIHASLRSTRNSPRSGLLGIILPSYYSGQSTINTHTIPPRLFDNLECNYASLYNWTTNPMLIRKWVQLAYENSRVINPVNSRARFGKNRPRRQNEWQ